MEMVSCIEEKPCREREGLQDVKVGDILENILDWIQWSLFNQVNTPYGLQNKHGIISFHGKQYKKPCLLTN